LFPNAISVLRNESSLSKSFERIGIRVTCPIRNLISAASLAPGRKLEPGIDKLIAVATRKEKMKALLSIVLAMVASFALGQTLRQPLMKTQDAPRAQQRTTTTSTTTEATGTITQFAPGQTIVLKESSGPVHYRFGKTVTYVTRSGKVLDQATVKSKIRVGVPVHVHYSGTGPNMVVDRVILEQD
jgi:hypothetical protein